MFLDDKLYQMCEQAEINEPEHVQKLYNDVMTECDNYIKKSLNPKMTGRQLKANIDRTFNLFDSFVKQLKQSKSNSLNILAIAFETYSFKEAYLKGEIKEVYESL